MVGEEERGGVSEKGICGSKATTNSTLMREKEREEQITSAQNCCHDSRSEELSRRIGRRRESEGGLEGINSHAQSCMSLSLCIDAHM